MQWFVDKCKDCDNYKHNKHPCETCNPAYLRGKLGPREIFKKVKTHLLALGKRDKATDGCCVYRNSDGSKRAVGCLISDNAYYAELNGQDVYSTEVTRALDISNVDTGPPSLELLDQLQYIHDGVDPSKWQHELDELEYDLFG